MGKRRMRSGAFHTLESRNAGPVRFRIAILKGNEARQIATYDSMDVADLEATNFMRRRIFGEDDWVVIQSSFVGPSGVESWVLQQEVKHPLTDKQKARRAERQVFCGEGI